MIFGERELLNEILEEWKHTNSILRDVRDALNTIATELKPKPLPPVTQKLILGKPVSQ